MIRRYSGLTDWGALRNVLRHRFYYVNLLYQIYLYHVVFCDFCSVVFRMNRLFTVTSGNLPLHAAYDGWNDVPRSFGSKSLGFPWLQPAHIHGAALAFTVVQSHVCSYMLVTYRAPATAASSLDLVWGSLNVGLCCKVLGNTITILRSSQAMIYIIIHSIMISVQTHWLLAIHQFWKSKNISSNSLLCQKDFYYFDISLRFLWQYMIQFSDFW